MINLLLFLFAVACLSVFAIFIVENSGTLTMFWFGYQIDTSAAFMLFAVAVLTTIFIFLALFLRSLFSAPARFRQRRNVNRLESGIGELTYSVAALASSNIDDAARHVAKGEKLLGKTPLTILLSAQIAKSRGDEGKTKQLLSQLLEHKETEYLAARLLSDGEARSENLPKALLLARKAQAINPQDTASGLAIVSLEVRLKHWHEALAALQKIKLPRREKNRLRALILLAHGKTVSADGRFESALIAAKQVIKILPDFLPAAEFAAETYAKNNMRRKAERMERNCDALTQKLAGEQWKCKSCGATHPVWEIHCGSCHGFDVLNNRAV